MTSITITSMGYLHPVDVFNRAYGLHQTLQLWEYDQVKFQLVIQGFENATLLGQNPQKKNYTDQPTRRQQRRLHLSEVYVEGRMTRNVTGESALDDVLHVSAVSMRNRGTYTICQFADIQ